MPEPPIMPGCSERIVGDSENACRAATLPEVRVTAHARKTRHPSIWIGAHQLLLAATGEMAALHLSLWLESGSENCGPIPY